MPAPHLKSADPAILQRMGWPAPDSGHLDPRWVRLLESHPDSVIARVVEQHRSGYVVATEPDVTMAVDSFPEWQKPRCPPEDRACVGDWVLLKVLDLHRPQIIALLPRHNVVKRGAAGEHFRQQLIAANIDVVFVVVGLDLDFNIRRLERYLTLVHAVDQTVVLFTKADQMLVDRESFEQAKALLDSQSLPWHALNAKDLDDVGVLNRYLHLGITAVLVGSSGVGKSTLTNALIGEELMRTNEVRSHDSRGKHTTTYRHLIPLASGACLIDTPGMRELKPVGDEDLSQSFEDIESLAAHCKFRDCKHHNEPGCKVRAAISEGTLDEARLNNYLKLQGEIARAQDQLATRLEQQAAAKVQSKALNKRLKQKHDR